MKTPTLVKLPRAEAAVLLCEQFEIMAWRLAPGDAGLREDLRNHMAFEVLRSKKARATMGYYAALGRCRARDYMRMHRIRGRADLKERAVARSGRLEFSGRRVTMMLFGERV